MNKLMPYNEKRFLGTYLVLLSGAIIAFLFIGRYEVFVAPFALLYAGITGINWKTAWWILLFFVPLSMHLYFRGDTLELSFPDEPMMWAFLLLLPVLFVNNPYIIPKWWLKDPVVLIVLLQFLWLIVAVAYSKVLFFSVKFLIAKTWYLAGFFIFPLWIFRQQADFIKGFKILIVPVIFTVLLILYRQWLVHFSFLEVNRAIGALYYNHVEYSTILSMLFPLLCIAYPLTKGKNIWIRRLVLFLAFLFLLAILLSYARAAILAVLFSAFVAVAIRYRLVNTIMPVFYGFIALFMAYLVTDNKYIDLKPDYEHTYMHGNFTEHIIATFRGQDLSSMERLYRWIAAVRMSADRPVVGYGPHSFYYFYKPYAVNMFKTYVSKNDEHSTTHNYFLYMLVEQGWPAMLLYALLIMVVLAKAQRTYFRFRDRFYKYCTLGLTMLFAASFVNNFFSELIETHKVGSLFYLSLALLVILNRKSKELAKDTGIAA